MENTLIRQLCRLLFPYKFKIQSKTNKYLVTNYVFIKRHIAEYIFIHKCHIVYTNWTTSINLLFANCSGQNSVGMEPWYEESEHEVYVTFTINIISLLYRTTFHLLKSISVPNNEFLIIYCRYITRILTHNES